LTRAVIPIAPDFLFYPDKPTTTLPSHITFTVNPWSVHSPQTGHQWFVEMEHDMAGVQMYSLIPQQNENHFATHYVVESQRPRFNGNFTFSDAWVTSHHRLLEMGGAEVHYSECLFHPERSGDKLYFDKAPQKRIEIIVPNRFIEDREIFALLEALVPKGCETRSLLQRLP
jgi:hypothetical protein